MVAMISGLVGLRTLASQRAAARAEARLGRLLESAADGVVEIDARGAVVRANRAFCAMVDLPDDRVVGAAWEDLGTVVGAQQAFERLRHGGQAVLRSTTRTVHLESRASEVPAHPPGTLLVIRDVSANKAAEQTIRTLLQFLEDRDEDRTRYLRRSGAAIEAERNRIARDLHDGPIQGVIAASLSLEAAKLLVGAGRDEEAVAMLGQIGHELGEETENLRRLMSDLRPPLLEERGLVVAVEALCERFREHAGIRVSLRANSDGLAPREVETIGYRVIQEALSNVARHANAHRVSVRVEGSRGVVEVEVSDDGVGFDASALRELLKEGKVGLASMRERTELGGGVFTVRSRPGAGTTVTATLPVDPRAPRR
jgi:PAS domain S-box-containing protein